jgi:hypothetical protein
MRFDGEPEVVVLEMVNSALAAQGTDKSRPNHLTDIAAMVPSAVRAS